jgi:hypothetical protein
MQQTEKYWRVTSVYIPKYFTTTLCTKSHLKFTTVPAALYRDALHTIAPFDAIKEIQPFLELSKKKHNLLRGIH